MRATSNGALSFFLVKPLYRPGVPLETIAERREAHVGFVTTVYAGTDLADVVRDSLPAGSRFTVSDGDEVLAATEDPPSGGVRRVVEVGGRPWTVEVQDGRDVDRGPGARRSRRSPSCWWPGSCSSSAGRGPTTSPPAGRPA